MLRVFFSLYSLLLIVILLDNNVIQSWFLSIYQQEFAEDISKDYAGAFVLMEQLYPHLNEAQWQQLFKHISDHTNLPVASRSIDQWQFNGEALQRIQQGQILVESVEKQILYQKIANNTVVRIGPMATIDSVKKIETLYVIVLASILGLVILLWTAWQQYKIRRLGVAADKFSEGKLNTRAQTGLWAIPILSNAFNIMAERIERLFQSHRHLTNAISHELRSPVAKIRFQLELLNNTKSQQEKNQLMMGISEDLDDMDTLIEEMLSYAKMERTEPDTHFTQQELGTWVSNQIERVTREIKTPLSATLPEADISIAFDPILMARLLRNLLCNADCYANKHIHVGINTIDNNCQLSVDDDGPGIPIEDRQHVFEPFYRVEKSRNRNTGGVGLGLAIVAQIARVHAGTIEVSDSPLGGARFTVTWPTSLAEKH